LIGGVKINGKSDLQLIASQLADDRGCQRRRGDNQAAQCPSSFSEFDSSHHIFWIQQWLTHAHEYKFRGLLLPLEVLLNSQNLINTLPSQLRF